MAGFGSGADRHRASDQGTLSMANFVINYMIAGTETIKMESDFYKAEGDYFVFYNKGNNEVFRIDKKHVGSVLTETETAPTT
jgi:hypothetical protein